MKTSSFLALTLSLLTPAAFAQDAKSFERQVLEALIVNSAQLTVVDESGRKADDHQQVPSLIAGALLGGYLGAVKEKNLVLNNVSVDCAFGPGNHGADQWDCSVNFLDGDFEVDGEGKVEGPIGESSTTLFVPVGKDSRGNVRILSKKLKAFMAG